MALACLVPSEGLARLALGLDQVEWRPLRVGDHRHVTDALHMVGPHQDAPAELLEPRQRVVDRGHCDIADPCRSRAAFVHLGGQLHDAHDLGVRHAAQAIVDTGRIAGGEIPAEQTAIEILRGIGIVGHQFVPDEIAFAVLHAHAVSPLPSV